MIVKHVLKHTHTLLARETTHMMKPWQCSCRSRFMGVPQLLCGL